MRNATVSILFIFICMFSHAQEARISKWKNILSPDESSSDFFYKPDKSVRLVKITNENGEMHLKNEGVEILRRLDKDLLIVESNEAAMNKLSTFVKETHPVNYQWKIQSKLLNEFSKSNHIILKSATTGKALADELRLVGGVRVISIHGNFVTVQMISSTVLRSLVMNDNIIYLGAESFQPVEESRVLDLNLNPNTVNQVHHFFPGLRGNDITISMKELQYNIDDIDLRGRNVPSSLAATTTSNHATDMATIAAGAGNSFVTGKGVAPKAKITSSTFENLFPDEDGMLNVLNVRLQNHSYGTVIENFYGSLSESYDQSSNRNPNLLYVFSSGNQGTSSATSGQYVGLTGFSNITGNSKMSKNSLVVGAVDTTGNPIFFSSRGPAHDGRVKPEVVAFSTAGTSNTSALVTGVVALLQQSYKEEFGQYPTSALLKALIINSANDVHQPHVDFVTGYGNVDSYRAAKNLKENKFISAGISDNEVKNFSVDVPANAKNLKVTLVWNDPAAAANSALALINDVDLSVAKNGTTWLPWILNSTPSLASLTAVATRGEDHLNNIEQVTVDVLESGIYTIAVKGNNIQSAIQDFSIAYQWDEINSFEWKFPTGSDRFPYNGETGTYFYWASTLPDETGKLEYSTDNGSSWSVIRNNIQLSKGYYRWDLSSIPPDVEQTAIARMVTTSGVYPTEPFTIAKSWFPEVGFNCDDSVLLQWKDREGVAYYSIYELGQEVMEPVISSPDTFFLLHKSNFDSEYFSVEPVLTSGKTGLRSPAVSYEAIGECYIRMFTERIQQNGVFLNLQLGTTYGVSSIDFEREGINNFHLIGSVSSLNGTSFEIRDPAPFQGLNRYRAKLKMTNGVELVSSLLDVFFITEHPFVVFPNPVTSGHELNIFSNAALPEPAIFNLFTNEGRLALNTTLFSDREFISLASLNKGMYYYQITSSKGIFRGKIFIR
jgi:hypothetical protein